jgi:hypothetical protein
MNLSGIGLFIAASSSLLVVGYLGDLYPLGSILARHTCLEISLFLLDFPVYFIFSVKSESQINF